MKFKFNNYSKLVGERGKYRWYKWKVFMDEPEENLNKIDSIEYQLDNTFPNPIRFIRDKSSKFAVEFSGQDNFEISIVIYLKDGTIENMEYNLDSGKPWPMYSTEYFTCRDGITEAEYFFNRDNEQSTVRAHLLRKQNCQIVGPRHIGKTSLLLQIERVASKWNQSVVVAYLDLQNPRCSNLSGWLDYAGRQFKWCSTPKHLVDFQNCVVDMLSKGQHPVLCLDDFEELSSLRKAFTRDFFLTLRSCGREGMSIITTSRKKLSELTEPEDPTSPFYNTFPVLELTEFSDSDAEDFVTLYPRQGVPPFTESEKRKILEFAKGHPLALKIACIYVLKAKENSESLSTAIQKAYDSMRAYLPDWGEPTAQ